MNKIQAAQKKIGVRVEIVVDDLTIPYNIDWISKDIILFTKRNGNLRMIENGKLLEESLLSLTVGGVEDAC